MPANIVPVPNVEWLDRYSGSAERSRAAVTAPLASMDLISEPK
jgi:hypothetical protein